MQSQVNKCENIRKVFQKYGPQCQPSYRNKPNSSNYICPLFKTFDLRQQSWCRHKGRLTIQNFSLQNGLAIIQHNNCNSLSRSENVLLSQVIRMSHFCLCTCICKLHKQFQYGCAWKGFFFSLFCFCWKTEKQQNGNLFRNSQHASINSRNPLNWIGLTGCTFLCCYRSCTSKLIRI